MMNRQTIPSNSLLSKVWLLKTTPPVLVLVAGMVFLVATIYHYLIYLPHPGQPHRLTVLSDVFSIGLLFLIGLVGLGIGRRLLRWFNLEGLFRLEHQVLAVGLGWGVMSLGILMLGVAHLLYEWVLVIACLLVLVLLWTEASQVLISLTSRTSYRFLRSLVPRTPFEIGLAGIVAAELVLVFVQSFTLPIFPRGWDLYTYHWAVPQLFLLHHTVSAVPGWASADFPLNNEMLDLVALAFGSPITAILLQLVFGLLFILLLVGFLYRHYGRLAAWMGTCLCLASPLYIGLLVSGYVEPAAAYYGVAPLVVLLLWLERPVEGKDAQSKALLFLAGVFTGLGIGTKYQNGMVLIGILLFLAGRTFWRVCALRGAGVTRKPLLNRLLLEMSFYSIGVILPLLPWLLKDWIALGNPIYPFVWGGPGWNAARAQVGTEQLVHFGPPGPLWQRLPMAFAQFFVNLWNREEIPYLPLNYLLVLAPLWIPMRLLVSWKQWSRWTKYERSRLVQESVWLAVPMVAYGIWVVSHATEERYALSWVMLLVVPTTIVWIGFWHVCHKRLVFRLGMQTVTILLLVVLGPAITFYFCQVANPVPLLSGQVSLQQWEQAHLDHNSDYWTMVAYVDSHLPADAKILLVGVDFGYFLQGHDYIDDTDGDWVPYLVTQGRTPSGIATLLRQEGFHYLIYVETNLEFLAHIYEAHSLDTYLPAFSQFLSKALIQVQVFGAYAIYRIPAT